MNPGMCLLGATADFIQWIKRSGVNVPCLSDHETTAVQLRQLLHFHASLIIGWYDFYACFAKSQQAESLEHRGMCVFADDHTDRRWAKKSIRAYIQTTTFAC